MDCVTKACAHTGKLLLRTHRVKPLSSPAAFQYHARRGLQTASRPRQSTPDSSKTDHRSSTAKNSDQNATPDADTPPPKPSSVSSVLANTDPAANNLLAPVHIPEDSNAVIKSSHPATDILAQSGLVVQRQIEMMNIFLGFEQANRYIIMDPHGNHVGYMAEHDGGFGKALSRQAFRTHRPFTTHVFDRHQKEVLRFNRPFSWINSRIRVYDPLEEASVSHMTPSSSKDLLPSEHPDLEAARHLSPIPINAMRIIGEAHSEWAPLRRKYNLFLSHDPSPQEPLAQSSSLQNFTQFAAIDEQFLSWDFSFKDQNNKLIGSVNRNFAGWGRELFTDMGTYALRMDSAGLAKAAGDTDKQNMTSPANRQAYAEAVGAAESEKGMTLDQRAVMLATAVTVDFDYFSRHSRQGGGMGFMPFWMFGGGGEAAGGAAGAEAGGAVVGGAASEAGGAVVGGAGRAVGGAAGAAGGIGEGAIAGAGTMAGYEAMQRAAGRRDEDRNGNGGGDVSDGDQASSQQPSQYGNSVDPQSPQNPQSGAVNEYGDPIESPTEGLDGQQPPPDTWGSGDADPWSQAPSDASEGASEGASGVAEWISSFFD